MGVMLTGNTKACGFVSSADELFAVLSRMYKLNGLKITIILASC